MVIAVAAAAAAASAMARTALAATAQRRVPTLAVSMMDDVSARMSVRVAAVMQLWPAKILRRPLPTSLSTSRRRQTPQRHCVNRGNDCSLGCGRKSRRWPRSSTQNRAEARVEREGAGRAAARRAEVPNVQGGSRNYLARDTLVWFGHSVVRAGELK